MRISNRFQIVRPDFLMPFDERLLMRLRIMQTNGSSAKIVISLCAIVPFFSSWTRERISHEYTNELALLEGSRLFHRSQIGRRNCRCSAAFDYDITVHLLRLSLSPDLRPERGVEGAGSINFDARRGYQRADAHPFGLPKSNGRV